MGSGHLGLRKIYKRDTEWKDKNSFKHKCNFDIHCILKVMSSSNNIDYYNVMKCNQCLSFKSIRENGNIQGYIFQELSEEQKNFPVITGFWKYRYNVMFAKLENVSYSDKI